ncbi:DUF2891 domain-containing protein [Sphingomonas sp.]|uniref:DUF2891 domain-containing protein n=1 Tax=Sphingomonas sp. TaxID=28214 RepID=UPI0025CC862B|nr:DUF2891 domain-containing protein [Sphingomonas sp.]
MKLDAALASNFAHIALGHVTREYPHKLDHVLLGDDDALPPRVLHPIFYGSFDWHSCVHGWWTLLTLKRLFPDIGEAAAITRPAGASFTAETVAAELTYLDRPLSAGFERPYGWGWLLYLHFEASRHEGRSWAAQLEPLARAFAERFKAYLPKLTYPIRVGTHFNTAFSLILALEWAERFDDMLADAIGEWAIDRFGRDRDCQAWEPGSDEFLSPALIEALCMSRVLPSAEFADWFAAFLPRVADREPATLFTPAFVSDRSDGKIAHLDGLNLSRAWCWRELGCPAHAEAHLAVALPHVAGDYMGEHWLASFALLATLAE